MMEDSNRRAKRDNTAKRLTFSIILLIILLIALCITTVAVVYSVIAVENNIFKTGYISINLNDGKPVIEEFNQSFEPGMAIEKRFFIENNSSWSVYYKIYLDNISGRLANVIQITISTNGKVLYRGTANELVRSGVPAADDELAIGERRWLTIQFAFPEDAGNAAQGQSLRFDLCADAVQTKNNPDKLFH